MTTETTVLAARAGITLERKALLHGVGQVTVNFVVNGPGPESQVFASEADARKTFDAMVKAQGDS